MGGRPKIYPRSLTATKAIQWGAFVCKLTCMVKGGLSIRALAVDDLQCDKSAAKRLNSGYLIENDWASFGTLIAQFVNSLLVSGWTAAGDFTISQSLSNVLLAFYLLLVQTMCAQNRHGAKWQRYWLPPVTIRNLCDLAGHFVLSSRFWPPNVPWRPKARQEACIEWFFGRAKSCTRGSPSTKDGLYGIQMAHAQQLHQARMWDEFPAQFVKAITDNEMEKIARIALDEACTFQVWVVMDL